MTSDGSAADRLATCVTAAESGGEFALESFRSALAVETKDGPMDAVTEVDRAVQRHVVQQIAATHPGEPVVGEEDVTFDGTSDGATDGETASVDVLEAVPPSGPCWVVDPIDGTNNYVSGNANWVTSVAFCRDGDPVAAANYAPVTGDLYAADPSGATRDGVPVSVGERSDLDSFLVNPIFGSSPRHRRELLAAVETVLSSFGDLRRFGCAQAALSGVAAGELDAAVSTVELHDWDTAAGVCLVREAGGVVTDVHGGRWAPGDEGLIASNGKAHGELVTSFEPSAPSES
ncbi:inositol monophosphatase [Halorarum halophilum]|uniref:fructose-bisphosphatase n=1 Tax=Halorarum halophilum TaxID=2743090 RepID=A0A7D5KLX5_9EURY|nr:inositol monophosphatase [Halobaculum halophilum]QLG27222.1 inositol monophosphatase [Halobaculum halophilum]